MKTDTEIQKDVLEEISWEPILQASEIGVAVKNGVVTLSGTLDSYFKKYQAENAAKRVTGVRAVASDIEVSSPLAAQKTDTEIARMIADSLTSHSAINQDKIKVKVDNGWVTMEGEVDWEYEREAVGTAIKNISGIKGMANLIRIKPAVTAKDIHQKIVASFQRHANLDSENIQVEVIGNKAVLSGTVRSWIERKDAENATWRAPGITAVENKLVIDANVLSV